MHDLKLEPFSAIIEWQMDKPLSADAWCQLQADFLLIVVKQISQIENAIIGHIKGFAHFPGGGFIQISAVSPQVPISISSEGNIESTFNILELSLNILVYGVPADTTIKITETAAKKISEEMNGGITIKAITGRVSHSSLHHQEDNL